MSKAFKTPKAVFFDLDNVLVFSEILHFKAWQQVMSQIGLHLEDVEFQNVIGISDYVEAQRLISKFSLQMSVDSLWEYKRANYLTVIQNGFDSPLGRNYFLEQLSQSCMIGLVSSSSNETINETLRIEGIQHYFDFIIGYEDSHEHKPHPLPYQLALRKAKVAPIDALVIEDSVAGITSAIGACIPVIGILRDQRPDQILKDVQYFNNFQEVHHWLL